MHLMHNWFQATVIHMPLYSEFLSVHDIFYVVLVQQYGKKLNKPGVRKNYTYIILYTPLD